MLVCGDVVFFSEPLFWDHILSFVPEPSKGFWQVPGFSVLF